MYKVPKPVIDKSSPIPFYLQAADWLEKSIAERRFRLDELLPSEGELAELLRLNRNTVRQAISVLVQKGYLEKQKGVGTFVRREKVLRPVHRLGNITSFFDDFDLQSVEIEDRVLSRRRVEADPQTAARLMVDAGAPVVEIERLRIANREPYLLERHHYPFERFGALLEMDLEGSLYQLLLKRFGIRLHHSVQSIRAVMPPKSVAALLQIGPRTPCIFDESLAYTADNACIEVLESHYRGDRYLFRVESAQYLGADPAAP